MAGAHKSVIDRLYRKLLLTNFFVKGWGSPQVYKKLTLLRHFFANRCAQLIPSDYPIKFDVEKSYSTHRVLSGRFRSPMAVLLPEEFSEECAEARFEIILPLKQNSAYNPICLHLAGTGDHFYWRRRMLMAFPLLKKHNIGSIILENPYYGTRKPPDQRRSSLHYVSDLFIMGGCLVLESLVLLNWCEQNNFGPLAISGSSMGGYMASLAACNWPKPICLIPCLSWSTASSVFTQGVMSKSIPWSLLAHQYANNEDLRRQLDAIQLVPVVNNDQLQKTALEIQIPNYSATDQNLFLSEHNASCSLQAFFENMQTFIQTCITKQQYVENEIFDQFDSVFFLKNLSGYNSNLNIQSHHVMHNPKSYTPESLECATKSRLHAVMDHFTHLNNFAPPVETSLITVVSALRDAYVIRDGVIPLNEIWPKAHFQPIDSGHVSSYLAHQSVFRKAIVDTLDRYMKMNY